MIIGDGRAFLEQDQNLYDVIIVDLVDMIEDTQISRLYTVEFYQLVARQSGWESSDNQDGHFGGRGEVMIVAARR